MHSGLVPSVWVFRLIGPCQSSVQRDKTFHISCMNSPWFLACFQKNSWAQSLIQNDFFTALFDGKLIALIYFFIFFQRHHSKHHSSHKRTSSGSDKNAQPNRPHRPGALPMPPGTEFGKTPEDTSPGLFTDSMIFVQLFWFSMLIIFSLIKAETDEMN